jgi:hypothetical protein
MLRGPHHATAIVLGTVVCCGGRTELRGGPFGDTGSSGDGGSMTDGAPDTGIDGADVNVPPVPCPPASTPLLLGSRINPTYDSELAVDATSVYMSDGERITSFPKCVPGTPQTLTGYEANSARVLVDQGTVYFIDIVVGGSVLAVSTSGGSVTALATAPSLIQPMSLSKVGSTLFFLLGPSSASSGIYSVSASGGTSAFVGSAAGSTLAADATSVYFFLPTKFGWGLHAMPNTGGTPAYLADSYYDGSIAVDDTTVYFSGWGPEEPGFVRSVSKQGGPMTVLSTPEHMPTYIALDATDVYWVDDKQSVLRVKKTGGTPETLVSGIAVAGIGLDATSLYYSTYTGDLYRLDK